MNARSYFGARYYRAQIGRFTTIDPVYTWKENLEDPQRWNRYSYVRNNPLRFVDPDGRTIEPGDFKSLVARAVGAALTAACGVGGCVRVSEGPSAVERTLGPEAVVDEANAAMVGVALMAVSAPKPTKLGGSITEPTLPPKTIVSEDGVKITHLTRSNDHAPAHLHVQGQGESTRIGQNGKPVSPSPELSAAQAAVVGRNIATVRKAVDAIQRWFRFQLQ